MHLRLSRTDKANDAAAQAEAAAAARAIETREECILKIDHMNDADGYRKILNLGARARARQPAWLYANSGTFVHGVYVVLHGAPSSVGGFLQRLRTETVDVDRSGRPGCKRSGPPAAPPVADRPPPSAEEEELEDTDGAPTRRREAGRAGNRVSARRSWR